MKTILIKFAGPLQSWGTKSHFEYRHTDSHPSKSAVIGMIAAAFGYRRCEDSKIQALSRLDFAVRVDQAGYIIEDYQTVHKYKYTPDEVLERTYVTHREYLEDAVFVAAVGGHDERHMDEIEQAMKEPYFQMYAGRRACPLTADCLLGCVELDVISALKGVPWQAAEWYKKKGYYGITGGRPGDPVRLSIYADADLIHDSKSYVFMRDDPLSFSAEERVHHYRREGRTEILIENDLAEKKMEHDAFGAL